MGTEGERRSAMRILDFYEGSRAISWCHHGTCSSSSMQYKTGQSFKHDLKLVWKLCEMIPLYAICMTAIMPV